MRYIGLLLFLIFQLTITGLFGQGQSINLSLPQVGDIHFYKLDNLPDQLNLNFQNGRSSKNLSILSAPSAHEYSFKRIQESLYSNFFIGATLVSFDLWQNEKFYKKMGNGLFLIGEVIKSGRDRYNPLIKTYTDPQPVYATSHTVNTQQEYLTKWEVVFNENELKNVNEETNAIYKLIVIEENEISVEDVGTLFLPRERFTDVISTVREVKSSYQLLKSTRSNEWDDVTDIIDQQDLPIRVSDSYKEVVFLNQEHKEWLAYIKSENGKVESALYKSDQTQVKLSNLYDNSNFFLYPNPTFGVVRLDFVNLPEETYFFEVYNIIGKKLWSQKYTVDGYTTVKEDLSFLNKGTYLYSLTNSHGEKLFTKRMAIITP